MVKRTNSQPPIEIDETLTEGAEANGVNGDHEMAVTTEADLPQQATIQCQTSPKITVDVQACQTSQPVILEPPVIEQTIENETRQAFTAKVGYF